MSLIGVYAILGDILHNDTVLEIDSLLQHIRFLFGQG
jgi:hypothetical protein